MKPYRLFADQYEGNPDPNLALYVAAGHVLYAHKATEGAWHIDAKHVQRVKEAHGLNLAVMHYHYLVPEAHDPHAEVEFFWEHTRHSFQEGVDLLALDFETTGKLPPEMLAAYLIDAYTRLLEISEHDARIYGSTAFLLANARLSWIRRRARWQAQYGSRPLPGVFLRRWWAWQMTDGTVGPMPHRLSGIPAGDVSMLRLGPAVSLKRSFDRRGRRGGHIAR